MKLRTPLIICAHVGLQKEDHLLYHVYSKDAWKWRKPWYEFLVNDSMCPQWKYEWGNKSKYAFHQNLDEIHELFQKPTLETYIKYYRRHYQRVKHEYSYVADFSNSNAQLPLSFLEKIAPELRKKYPTSKDYYWSYLKIGNYSINCEYVKRIKYYKSIFSTTTIVSEDLWGGKNDAREKLSNFLQYDIKKLWPNCYYPEMGTKTPVLERKWNLSDQWGSDLEDLTDEDLSFGRKYLAKYYDEWYDMFGTTPWG